MNSPVISVVIPARNEGDRLPPTLHSIVNTRTGNEPLEIVIVDDASADGCCSNLVHEFPKFTAADLTIRILTLNERVGVPRARNCGAFAARGEILFITDAHVTFSEGWDQLALQHITPYRILAASIADPASGFRAFGCTVAVPFMGTHWVRDYPNHEPAYMQVAACPGTVIYNDLFRSLGGYDPGMVLYSAAEPEFSVRAWLAGAEIVAVPDITVMHRFKPAEERNEFVTELRPAMIHNSLRFGLLYLSDQAAMQMIRYFAMKFPKRVAEAYGMIVNSDVWLRRLTLRRQLRHDFAWFVRQFNVKNQVGKDILL